MKKQIKNRTRRGAAIALVMAIIVLLTISGLALLAMGQHARFRTIADIRVMNSRSAADAGLQHAKFMIRQALATTPWPGVENVTGATLPGTNITYSYTVTGDPTTGLEVTSTGSDGVMSRTVHSSLTANHSYLDGITGIESYVWINNKIIMNTIPSGQKFGIRTNSTGNDVVSIYNNSFVPADIIIGPGGDTDYSVWIGNGSTVNGDIYAAPEQESFPSVVPPTTGAFAGAPQPKITGATGTVSSDGKYAGIDLGNGKTLNVSGNVTLYVTGDVKLGNSAEIVVANGSSLTLYLDGKIDDKNSSAIKSASADPTTAATSIKILGTDSCASLDIKSSSNFYGAIYAPKADVIIRNSAKVYGAAVGKSFSLYAQGEFWYIAALKNAQMGNVPPELEEVRWWE